MNMVILVVGMMAVTYAPRLLPLIVMEKWRLPKRLRTLLKCLPYAALGALLMPGGLDAVAGQPVVSVAGMGVAFAAAWMFRNTIVTVFAAIAVVFLLLALLPS